MLMIQSYISNKPDVVKIKITPGATIILAVTATQLIFAADKEVMEGNGGVPFFFYHDPGFTHTNR